MSKMVNLQKLNGGFELITKEDVGSCHNCRKPINEYDFFWCERLNKFFCGDCIRRGNHKEVCFTSNHIDWHIIRVSKPEV